MSGQRQNESAGLGSAVAVRRELLHRILTEQVPRGDVTPPSARAVGPLAEALELRRQLDEALRAHDHTAADAVRERARRLLAAEAGES